MHRRRCAGRPADSAAADGATDGRPVPTVAPGSDFGRSPAGATPLGSQAVQAERVLDGVEHRRRHAAGVAGAVPQDVCDIVRAIRPSSAAHPSRLGRRPLAGSARASGSSACPTDGWGAARSRGSARSSGPDRRPPARRCAGCRRSDRDGAVRSGDRSSGRRGASRRGYRTQAVLRMEAAASGKLSGSRTGLPDNGGRVRPREITCRAAPQRERHHRAQGVAAIHHGRANTRPSP